MRAAEIEINILQILYQIDEGHNPFTLYYHEKK